MKAQQPQGNNIKNDLLIHSSIENYWAGETGRNSHLPCPGSGFSRNKINLLNNSLVQASNYLDKKKHKSHRL